MLPRRLSTGGTYCPRGAMQHAVTILHNPEDNRDDEGSFLPPFQVVTTWANIVSLQGRDLEKAQQIVAEVQTKVIIPYLPDIHSDMTIQFEDRSLIIRAVNDPDERKVELWLYCEERNDGGSGQ